MGTIRFRCASFLGCVSETVGDKSGLTLAREDLIRHATEDDRVDRARTSPVKLNPGQRSGHECTGRVARLVCDVYVAAQRGQRRQPLNGFGDWNFEFVSQCCQLDWIAGRVLHDRKRRVQQSIHDLVVRLR